MIDCFPTGRRVIHQELLFALSSAIVQESITGEGKKLRNKEGEKERMKERAERRSNGLNGEIIKS